MAPRKHSGKRPSAEKPKPNESRLPVQVPSASLTPNQAPAQQQGSATFQGQQQQQQQQAQRPQGTQPPTVQQPASGTTGMDIDPPQQGPTGATRGVGLGGFGDIEEALETVHDMPESWLQRARRNPQPDLIGPLMAMLEHSKKRKVRSPSPASKQATQGDAKKSKRGSGPEPADYPETTESYGVSLGTQPLINPNPRPPSSEASNHRLEETILVLRAELQFVLDANQELREENQDLREENQEFKDETRASRETEEIRPLKERLAELRQEFDDLKARNEGLEAQSSLSSVVTAKAPADAEGQKDDIIKEMRERINEYQWKVFSLKSTIDATVNKDWAAIRPYMDERLVQENPDLRAKVGQTPDDAVKDDEEVMALREENTTLKAQILRFTDVEEENYVLNGTIQSLEDALRNGKATPRQSQAIEAYSARLEMHRQKIADSLDTVVNGFKDVKQSFNLDAAEDRPRSATTPSLVTRQFIERETSDNEVTAGEGLSVSSSLFAESSEGPQHAGLSQPGQLHKGPNPSNTLNLERDSAEQLPTQGQSAPTRMNASFGSASSLSMSKQRGLKKPEPLQKNPTAPVGRSSLQYQHLPTETRASRKQRMILSAKTDPSQSIFQREMDWLEDQTRSPPGRGSPQPIEGSSEAIAIAEANAEKDIRRQAIRNQAIALRAAQEKEAADAHKAAAEKLPQRAEARRLSRVLETPPGQTEPSTSLFQMLIDQRKKEAEARLAGESAEPKESSLEATAEVISEAEVRRLAVREQALAKKAAREKEAADAQKAAAEKEAGS